MDITDIRRENLRRWIAKHGTPSKEKSLFSQLKSTGSFGEKVARRLEQQYKMGDLYLDTPEAEVQTPPVAPEDDRSLGNALKLTCETAEELRLLIAYRLGDAMDRQMMDDLVDEVRARLPASVRNKG